MTENIPSSTISFYTNSSKYILLQL